MPKENKGTSDCYKYKNMSGHNYFTRKAATKNMAGTLRACSVSLVNIALNPQISETANYAVKNAHHLKENDKLSQIIENEPNAIQSVKNDQPKVIIRNEISEGIYNDNHDNKSTIGEDTIGKEKLHNFHSIEEDELTSDAESSKSDIDASFSPPSDNEWDEDFTSAKTKRRRVERKRKTHKKHHYTEEENRRMIQYLISNNAIHRSKSIKTWNEFLANEVLDEPIPSAHALRAHFRSYLMNDYQKYTNDPVALQEFEKGACKKLICKWYTEEEDQCMINYLIDNNKICHAMGEKTWEGCLKASPILQKSNRTPSGLRNRFFGHLRYNYVKYTSDPTALKRFKDMEMKRPHRGHFERDMKIDFEASKE